MEWRGVVEDMQNDSQNYIEKRRFFDKVLTIYGRNPIIEALENSSLSIYRLHLSSSNKNAQVLEKMVEIAKKRGIEILYHDKKSLSRISKNSKQDQGVALDIELEHFTREDEFLASSDSYRVLALDGITNPQNLGMIIRSAMAGSIDAILLPGSKNLQISPLVIKASVGTIFEMTIIRSDKLSKSLQNFKSQGAKLYTLSSYAQNSYKEQEYTEKSIFILGNESFGVSPEIEKISDKKIKIPMNRGVESLNVAVTASLLAFM